MATQQYYYGTGRRKTSTARVRLYPGEGAMVINGKPAAEYFSRDVDMVQALEPLRVTGTENQYMISVKVVGGGLTGQAGAIRHGIARALLAANPEFRPRSRALAC